MNTREKDERDYRELRANVNSGVEKIPYLYGKLPLAAQARLNRLVIANGLMFVYWDSLSKQRELAEAFVPLRNEKRLQSSYENSYEGRTMRRIHETLDEKGIPHYPEQSRDESYAASVLRVLITATLKLKSSDKLRTLPRGERLDLRKLHKLSRRAGELEANTGQSS